MNSKKARRCSPTFTADLIAKVEARPALWNSSHPAHKNRVLHFRLWKEIATQLNVDQMTLRKRFKNLKDQFRKEYKKALRASGGGDEIPEYFTPGWHNFHNMMFLKDEILNTKDRTVNQDSDSESQEASTPAPKPEQRHEFNVEQRMMGQYQMLSNDVTKADPDFMFLVSLLPMLQQLTDIQKLQFRGKVNQWLLDTMTQNSFVEVDCDTKMILPHGAGYNGDVDSLNMD